MALLYILLFSTSLLILSIDFNELKSLKLAFKLGCFFHTIIPPFFGFLLEESSVIQKLTFTLASSACIPIPSCLESYLNAQA